MSAVPVNASVFHSLGALTAEQRAKVVREVVGQECRQHIADDHGAVAAVECERAREPPSPRSLRGSIDGQCVRGRGQYRYRQYRYTSLGAHSSVIVNVDVLLVLVPVFVLLVADADAAVTAASAIYGHTQ